MRKKIAVLGMAVVFVLGLAPVASAGPGSAACRAITNAYENTSGKDAPWACLQ